jgi:hypothetical protein
MARRIAIQAGKVAVEAELNNNVTSDAVWESLPIKGTANTWGNEVYFSIPVTAVPENGQEVVNVGDIAYWPPGKALCLFFGPTPVSRGNEVRAASAVNVIGRITGNPEVLSAVRDGEEVLVSRKE